jgi:uncharacterized protein (TIGR03435 family)
MRALAGLAFGTLLSSIAVSQSAETRPAFEAVEIQRSAPARFQFMRGPTAHAGHYELRQASMVDLVATAYGFNQDEVLDGPSWLEEDRFDVIAKLPPDSTRETQKAMLQTLLADRFKLVVHVDKRPMPAIALTVGKKALFKESDGSGEERCDFKAPPQPPPRPVEGAPAAPFAPTFTIDCHNMTMARFSEELRGMFNNDNKPVTDHTGLKGAWDFTFKFTPNFQMGGDTGALADAVDKQLGLKMTPAKEDVPVIIVDSVNEQPTANAPNITEILHLAPPPTEFEVAEIKPSDPDSKARGFQIQRGGRVNIAGMTLKNLIFNAWNLTDDMLIGAPKWLDEDRFSIIAKAPSTAGEIDIETVFFMLRALLKDRFKLEVHMEDRPINAYTLLAGKPKMQKADPNSRTRFKEGPAADGKDPRVKNPVLGRLVTVQNMTMAQFAAKLQQIASGYIHSPVLDATGLEGSWNFTLSFSPAGALQNGGRGGGGRGGDAPPPGPGGLTEASDPSGAISLPEAIDKQLGLKLEMRKRPVQVLVIDHIEQKPTEN